MFVCVIMIIITITRTDARTHAHTDDTDAHVHDVTARNANLAQDRGGPSKGGFLNNTLFS